MQEYATEVDVDFVRKSVRAIGRCAIKVEQSAERCVSTLLDLIQTKVRFFPTIFGVFCFSVADPLFFLLDSDPDLDHPKTAKFLQMN
jgi:hypothetical protein